MSPVIWQEKQQDVPALKNKGVFVACSDNAAV